MRFYLHNLIVSGIKNIKEPLKLNFYNKILIKPIKLEGTNIKAIYGANGVGKSAIIHAIDIYQNLITRQDYLFTDRAKFKLSELINKETKTFNLEISFFVFDNETNFLEKYRHEIVIKEKNEVFYIEKEKLIKILTKTEKRVVEIKNGKIYEGLLSEKAKEPFVNKLDRRSIVEVFISEIYKKNHDAESYINIFPFVCLGFHIYVNTEDIDKHELYFSILEKTKGNKEISFDYQYKISSRYTYIISKNNKKLLIKEFKETEEFIKIFKPDLLKIDLKFKEDKEFLYVDPYFIYDNYKIHLEFESAGIKKLTKLFKLLKLKEEGNIVFIDDFDSNINDVYLIKLLEYFKESENGQLVFTTHNISPMEVLSDNKHSIDFITENKKITAWKKSGNYKVSNLYQSGLIKGLPFNVYPFDFVGIFRDDE